MSQTKEVQALQLCTVNSVKILFAARYKVSTVDERVRDIVFAARYKVSTVDERARDIVFAARYKVSTVDERV